MDQKKFQKGWKFRKTKKVAMLESRLKKKKVVEKRSSRDRKPKACAQVSKTERGHLSA